MPRLFRVTGQVQAVGYRWWTRKTAERLGLRGTVRNCSDGSVEVLADGPEAAVQALAGELRRGPRSAVVAEVEERSPPPDAAVPEGFDIVA